MTWVDWVNVATIVVNVFTVVVLVLNNRTMKQITKTLEEIG